MTDRRSRRFAQHRPASKTARKGGTCAPGTQETTRLRLRRYMPSMTAGSFPTCGKQSHSQSNKRPRRQPAHRRENPPPSGRRARRRRKDMSGRREEGMTAPAAIPATAPPQSRRNGKRKGPSGRRPLDHGNPPDFHPREDQNWPRLPRRARIACPEHPLRPGPPFRKSISRFAQEIRRAGAEQTSATYIAAALRMVLLAKTIVNPVRYGEERYHRGKCKMFFRRSRSFSVHPDRRYRKNSRDIARRDTQQRGKQAAEHRASRRKPQIYYGTRRSHHHAEQRILPGRSAPGNQKPATNIEQGKRPSFRTGSNGTLPETPQWLSLCLALFFPSS